jgi:hypothetical protein
MQACVGGQRIDSDPRCLNEKLYSAQFRILYLVGVPLLMTTSYHAGFM